MSLKSHVLFSSGCQFYPVGEYLKFVRVPENLERGTEILSLEVHPRSRLTIAPVDKVHTAISFHIKSFLRKAIYNSTSFVGGGRRFFRLQGNESDACFLDLGAVSGRLGGHRISEESIEISRYL